MRKALVIVDMQNDFVTGSLGTKEAQQIIPNILKEMKSDEYEKIYVTQDTHNQNYLQTQEGKNLPVEHCIYQSKGWEIIPEMQEELQKTELPVCYIEKPSFGTSQLSEMICKDGFDEVVFVGVCTGICVISNAILLKAADQDVVVYVKADCCACVTPETHKAALTVMETCQIHVI